MVDVRGNVAAHTGRGCIAEAGHVIGDGFSVQANMMLRPTVPKAMAAAYRSAEGTLAERLLAALEAAEAEGVDIRGRQSACLLIVRTVLTGCPWEDRLMDPGGGLSDPLSERPACWVQRAYARMDAATPRWPTANTTSPGRILAAERLYGENEEIVY